MKVTGIIITLFLFLAIQLTAQDKNDFESYWLKNFEVAQDSSAKTNKPILINFSGSDWCKSCIKLRNQVLDTQEFMEFATKTFVLVHADFPYHSQISVEQRKQNELLAEKYNTEGAFPKLVIVTNSGNVLYSCGYMNYSPAQYIDLLKSKL